MPYFGPTNPHRQQQLSYLDPLVQLCLSQRALNQTSSDTNNPSEAHNNKWSLPSSLTSAELVSPQNPNNNKLAFSPKFDVYETPNAFHLEGELPGISDRKSIEIFSDDQTLTIRGRVEKLKSVVTTPVRTARGHTEETTQEKRKSLNPTVEDADDDFSLINAATSKGKDSDKKSEVQKIKDHNDFAQDSSRKVWLSERSFGNFQRSFSFPSPVDLDRVTAKLDNGILVLTVSKNLFTSVRKIEID